MIIAHTPSGKEINLQIIGGKLLAEIAAAGITGSISGAYKLTRPKIGCTHYAECAGKQIGLDAANYQIIRGMLDEINAAARKAEQDRLSLHVPGMDVLCAAHNAEEYYQRGFERMMEDGDNDGVRPPRRPATDAAEIARQYPRAAVYLRSEAYECASHDAKASAGRKAKELLASGGSIEEAKKILANWLPISAQWD